MERAGDLVPLRIPIGACAVRSAAVVCCICTALRNSSADLTEATLQLEALDALIRNLRPADDPKSANDALAALVGHHCMALAMSDLDAGSLRAERAVALVDFWRSGGETWIRSRLEQAATRVAAFPPPMRKVVAKETRNGQLVDELLCPLADTNCGSESAGWWLRAEARFRDLAVQVGPGFKPRPPDNGAVIPTDLFQPRFPTEQECRDQALEQPVAGRYAFGIMCTGKPQGRVRVCRSAPCGHQPPAG